MPEARGGVPAVAAVTRSEVGCARSREALENACRRDDAVVGVHRPGPEGRRVRQTRAEPPQAVGASFGSTM
jgi:hypothetical protein